MKLFGIIILAAALSGCTSISRNECARADWRARGESDGAVGRPHAESGWYSSWSKACAKYPDSTAFEAQYNDGVWTGLNKLCTPANARDLGRAGEAFPSSCPREQDAQLRAAYHEGHQNMDLNRREEDLRRREADLQRREEDLLRRQPR